MDAKIEQACLADLRALKLHLTSCEASLMLLQGVEGIDPLALDMIARDVSKGLLLLKRADVLSHRLRQVA